MVCRIAILNSVYILKNLHPCDRKKCQGSESRLHSCIVIHLYTTAAVCFSDPQSRLPHYVQSNFPAVSMSAFITFLTASRAFAWKSWKSFEKFVENKEWVRRTKPGEDLRRSTYRKPLCFVKNAKIWCVPASARTQMWWMEETDATKSRNNQQIDKILTISRRARLLLTKTSTVTDVTSFPVLPDGKFVTKKKCIIRRNLRKPPSVPWCCTFLRFCFWPRSRLKSFLKRKAQ